MGEDEGEKRVAEERQDAGGEDAATEETEPRQDEAERRAQRGRRAADRVLFSKMRAAGGHLGDGARARERLIERYLPLARRLARRYQRSDEPIDDLVQVASLGLIKAVDRFDASRDVAFSSYAVPTILGEIKRHFRDKTWSLRVPRDLQELVLRIDQTVTALSAHTGRSPSVSELADALNIDEERVLDALAASSAYRAGSLDAPRAGQQDEEPGETLADAIGTSEQGFERAEQRATLQPLFKRISERERLILALRFGEGLTQAEIGERIGVSQMQVSRLIRQSLTRLRADVDSKPGRAQPPPPPPS